MNDDPKDPKPNRIVELGKILQCMCVTEADADFIGSDGNAYVIRIKVTKRRK